MRYLWVSRFTALALAVALAGCARLGGTHVPTERRQVSGSISIAGSTSVQPLVEKLAEVYMAANRGVRIDVQGGGSSVGVKSVAQAMADIGNISRELQDTERQSYPDLQVHKIALEGMAAVVHPGVVVDRLTTAQVQGIFAGEITNWSEVGGAARPIVIVAREEGSGTRDYFQERFMGQEKQIAAEAILQNANGALRTAVSSTPNAIGFLSFGYLDAATKALAIDGVEPRLENIRNGSYSAVRPFSMLTRGEPSAPVEAFLGWILSDEGQRVVESEGYLAVN